MSFLLITEYVFLFFQLVVLCLLSQIAGIIYVTVLGKMYRGIISPHGEGYLPITIMVNCFVETGPLLYLFSSSPSPLLIHYLLYCITTKRYYSLRFGKHYLDYQRLNRSLVGTTVSS